MSVGRKMVAEMIEMMEVGEMHAVEEAEMHMRMEEATFER
jgi:hypothetical protein